jgi:cleavage and polyadenylation specificity factor subunit 3
MLQSGMSRVLLERWAPDQRNGVVMTGYNVEGTMARTILHEPEMIPAIMSGGGGGGGQGVGRRTRDDDAAVMIPRRCTVEEFQFAAHVTGVENVDFIEQVAAPHVILVHGERSQAARLRSRLLDLNNRRLASNPSAQQTKVYSPENGAEVKIPFRKDKVAKVVGKLAQIAPPTSADSEDTRVVNGVLVQNGFKLSLMAPEDLREYAGLTTTTILCRQHITLSAAGVELIKWALEGTFGSIEDLTKSTKPETNGHSATSNGASKTEVDQEEADEEIVSEPSRTFLVMGCIKLTWSGGAKQIELEWEGNTMNDGIADAVMAVLMTVESSPAAVKYSSSKHRHSHGHRETKDEAETNGTKPSLATLKNEHANLTPEDRLGRLCMFLEEQFGENVTPIEKPKIKSLPESKPAAAATEINAKKEETAFADGKNEDQDEDEDDVEAAEAAERARLAAMGIPVPGLQIQFDKHIAKLWLETLEVECTNTILRDRIKAVVERAVETVAPLWAGSGGRIVS